MLHIDSYNFAGKKAIIRVDFNVPLDKKTLQITDDTRIRGALPTIKKILADGGSVVLMSHLGRPENGPEDKFSLKHLLTKLNEVLGVTVKFASDCISAEAIEMKKALKAGEVLLLENLRFYKEEEKGNEDFAKKLAEGVDVYVNDAFGTAHRAHASTAIIAKFFPGASLFGYLMDGEVASLEKVLGNPTRPFLAVLGGAKVSDKIKVIDNLIDIVDVLIIGGGMTYTFIKAMGGNIGASLCEQDKLDVAKALIEKAKAKNVKLLLPKDNVVASKFDNAAETKITAIDAVPEGWMGLDIADGTIKEFKEVIMSSKTILWNGPMGVFEMENFAKGTIEIAKAIAESTAKGAYSLVGGGDSVAAVNKYHLADKVSYVSTGGGAMLEYVEGKVLPGIKAIKEGL